LQKKRQNRRQTTLDINRSIELANYYIGFNHWSSSIISLSQDSLEYNETAKSFKCSYSCKVMFRLVDGRTVEASGTGNTTANEKRTAIEYSKKNAVTDARKKAFEKVVLINLESGKVAVHFLNEEIKQL